MKKYVYSFGAGTAEGDGKMRDTLGGKGAGLAEMSKAGVPVPPGFTISTEVCNLFFENGNKVPAEVDEQIEKALAKLEQEMHKKLGGADDPLLVSVRSGAKFSMPGMMNTILNLGLNDRSTEGSGQQDRQSALRLRLLSPFHPDVRRGCARHRYGEIRSHLRFTQSQSESETRYGSHGRRFEIHHRRIQKAGQKRDRPRVSAGCARTAHACTRRRFQLLEHAQSDLLSPHGKDSGFHWHRRQRSNHGLREHGR